MKLILLNILVLAIVASPLFALEQLRKYSKRIDERHDGLSIIVWFVTLLAVYVFVLSRLGLVPNPAFFRQ